MSTKYHINPDTNEVGVCRAKIKCKFGATADEHFTDPAEALAESERRDEAEFSGKENPLKGKTKVKPNDTKVSNRKTPSITYQQKKRSAIAKKKPATKAQVQKEVEKLGKQADILREEKRLNSISQYHYGKKMKELSAQEDEAYSQLPVEEILQLDLSKKKATDRKKINIHTIKSIKEENETKARVAAEKQEFYNNLEPMSSYKKDIANMLVEDGEFFKPAHSKDADRSWGDSRGASEYGAQSHFKECGVAGFNKYSENATWSEYDTFNSNDYAGIEAEVSCNCQKHFKSRVYLNGNAGSIMSRLLNKN